MPLRLIVVAFFLLLSLYLGFHAIYGPRGYYVWQEKKQYLPMLQMNLAELEKQKSKLENKVSLLQHDLDEDLLEQLMWSLFRFINPQKKVILLQ